MEIRNLPLPHFDFRPPNTLVDTIVIHAMHVPSAQDPFSPKACADVLNSYQVSAHYLLDRSGIIWQCVDESKRAWHAGQSTMPYPDDQRENVNHFSIGIELIGKEDEEFASGQYEALSALCAEIAGRFPIKNVLGHEHVAPHRKTDPGPLFDWRRFRAGWEKLGKGNLPRRFGI